MAESTEMRLVRCPKCENVLPELAGYSVYKCGGCGAVLRAEKKDRESIALLEKSDDEKIAVVAANLQNSVEKGIMDSSDVCNSNVKLNGGSLRSEDKGPEKSHDIGCADRCRHQSAASTSGQWVNGNDHEMNGNVDGLRSNEVGRRNGDLNSQLGDTSGSVRPGKRLNWQLPERGKMKGFRRIIGSEVEDVRFSNPIYPDEGPSNCKFDDSYHFGEPFSKGDNHDGPDRVQYLEKDQVELFRKLDELKEQLSRSCSVADQTHDKGRHNGNMAPPDPYGGSKFRFPGVSPSSDRDSMQFLGSDKHGVGPRYCSHHPDPFMYNDGNRMEMHRLHPSLHKPNYIPGYGDPFGPQMIRRVSHQLPAQYQQPPAGYFSRHYFEPQASDAKFHLPSCSCFRCYDKHHGVPPAPLFHRRFPVASNDHIMRHHEYPGAFGAHASYSRSAGPQSHSRWSSDLNSEMGGFVLAHPQRLVLANSGRCCRPVAGGAPFFTCFNCFELLKLPKKVMAKNHQKIRCGACSTIINLAVVNKKLVLSVNSESMLVPAEEDDSSDEIMEHINANFSSDDYDNSIYDFRTVEANPIVSSAGQDINSSDPQEIQRFHSSSPSTSEGENSLDILISPRKVTNSMPSPPACGSPPVKHCLSSDNQVGNHLGKGNQSSRTHQEKVSPSKATIRQNSMKEATMATEMVLPFHECCNTGVSQDAGDGSREKNQLKINKGGESFLANIIKRSFKDFSIFNQPDGRGRNNVSVNGHIIPNRLVKKAEKQAGPIHPGQYWYDFQAGFWGVIGGPCLGIIPPFIEELTYSMPTNCSGGDTGVFVNRRELHRKDLDLLVTRGLPTERNRYYAIDISGRVLDEDTGEELDSLGRLAPTIEKVKHGFGMKVPTAMKLQQ